MWIWSRYHDAIFRHTRVCKLFFCSFFVQGSRFYENELKREQQVNQRIEKMILQKAQITEQQLKKAQAQVSKYVIVSTCLTLIIVN